MTRSALAFGFEYYTNTLMRQAFRSNQPMDYNAIITYLIHLNVITTGWKKGY